MLSPDRFVVFSQNHDQIGNRLYGERLTQLVDMDQVKLAAACTLLSSNVPMLFMGEEYGESNPFLYFVDHEDPRLRRAVKRGRLRDFHAYRQAGRAVPDPGRVATFNQSRLTPRPQWSDSQKQMFEFYQALIGVRRDHLTPATHGPFAGTVTHDTACDVILLQREHDGKETLVALNFSPNPVRFVPDCSAGLWQLILDSMAWSAENSARKLSKHWEKKTNGATDPLELAAWQVAVWTRTPD